MKIFSAALVVFALGATAPALSGPGDDGDGPSRMHAERKRDMMFEGVSEAGRTHLRAAMMDARSPQNRAEIRAARLKILALVDKDRLDIPAIQRAQAEERAVVVRHARARQDAMLAAIRKLSPADRKAFAMNVRKMDGRMEERMKRVKDMMHDGPDGRMPPPPE